MWAVMSLYHLYNPMIWITRAAAASSEVFAMIDAAVPDTSGVVDADSQLFKQDIIFQDVTFAYPARPSTVILNKLNAVFENGKTTAIVGPSGAGKSTIVGLLERWYQPITQLNDVQSMDFSIPNTPDCDKLEKLETFYIKEIIGRRSGIYIGSINLNTIDTKWWRSNIGLVQQEPFLFNDTIYQNVANGLAGTKFEHAPTKIKLFMVQNACQEAFADEFIVKLPEGYNTLVGEGGLRLSGGQRQRLAIARAIVKDPAILILDEATSAIDVRSEKIVQKALDRAAKSRTTVVIAHRLSTIKNADKIVVIKEGRIWEEGTHAQLLQLDGAYSSLVRAQEIGIGSEEQLKAEMQVEEQVEIDMTSESASKLYFPNVPPEKEDKGNFKERGFLRSLGYLILHHPAQWKLFLLTFIAAMGGGGMISLSATVFCEINLTVRSCISTSSISFWQSHRGFYVCQNRDDPERAILGSDILCSGIFNRFIILHYWMVRGNNCCGKVDGRNSFRL
jgi:ATP-binding cassette, subfamily B (MDR/TAP), member 1